MFDYEDEEITLDYFGGVDAMEVDLEMIRAIEDEGDEDDEE